MLMSMLDLMIVPSGAGWPRGNDDVFIRIDHEQRSGEQIVKVALHRTAIVAGGTYTPAPAIVESFLYQIARPDE